MAGGFPTNLERRLPVKLSLSILLNFRRADAVGNRNSFYILSNWHIVD